MITIKTDLNVDIKSVIEIEPGIGFDNVMRNVILYEMIEKHC